MSQLKEKQHVAYISGPMTGKPELNYPEFNEMEQRLKDMNYIVLNPACLPMGLTDAQYMDIGLAMVRSADCLVMLEGWEDSGGAQAEYALANRLEYDIFEQCGPAIAQIR